MDNLEEDIFEGDIAFDFMWKDEVKATVTFNYHTGKLEVENYTEDILNTPFGKRDDLTIDDLDIFFEDRCVPRTRANIQDFLDYYNLPYYEPYAIVNITHGMMMEDFNWIRFEDKKHITFKDVRTDLFESETDSC